MIHRRPDESLAGAQFNGICARPRRRPQIGATFPLSPAGDNNGADVMRLKCRPTGSANISSSELQRPSGSPAGRGPGPALSRRSCPTDRPTQLPLARPTACATAPKCRPAYSWPARHRFRPAETCADGHEATGGGQICGGGRRRRRRLTLRPAAKSAESLTRAKVLLPPRNRWLGGPRASSLPMTGPGRKLAQQVAETTLGRT